MCKQALLTAHQTIFLIHLYGINKGLEAKASFSADLFQLHPLMQISLDPRRNVCFLKYISYVVLDGHSPSTALSLQ